MDFFLSRLGNTTILLPEKVLKSFEFRHGPPHRAYDHRGKLMYEKYSTIEVKVVTFLKEGEVLYRHWMTDGAFSGMDFHFHIAKISDVIESIQATSACGPIEELESLIAQDSAKVKNENRRKPFLEQMRYRNFAGDIHCIADKKVLKTLKFYELGGWDIEGHVEAGPTYGSTDMSTIVLVVTGLPEGKVLYRTPIDSTGEFVDLFEVRRIADVIEALEISGATGPIDELKALLPSKPSNLTPSYSSYDPSHSVSADGKPHDQSAIEKSEPKNAKIPNGPSHPSGRSKPGRKSSTVASAPDPIYERLTSEYAKWLESSDGTRAMILPRP